MLRATRAWRLGLWAPLVARKNYTGSGLGPEGGVIAVAYLGEGPRGTAPSPFFRPNWGPKGRKKIWGDRAPSLSQDLDYRPPTFLKVWISHWIDSPGGGGGVL